MTWINFYLICFIVGLLLSVVSFVVGDLHFHVHLPFHWELPYLHLGSVDAPHVPHGAGSLQGMEGLPAINFGTITTFLAWFGGIGYLLTRHSHLYAFAALAIAILGGLVGAAIVFLMITRVLLRYEADYVPEDSDMVGLLARITSSVFEGGTGEIVYVQGGTRHSCAARSEFGTAIPKGTEVVVTTYEKGVAYVRPWEDMQRELDEAKGVGSQ